MKNYTLETWQALAEADPRGTFSKLISYLELDFSTAEIILSDHNNDYQASCIYLIEKHGNMIKRGEVGNFPEKTNQLPSYSSKGGGAGWSLSLGIFSLIAWIYPLCGFPVSIIGLILGIANLKSQKHTLAIAGIVISSIGLLITTINSAIGAYLGYTGQLFAPQPYISSPQNVIPTPNIALTRQSVQSNAQATLTARATNTCLHWSKITSQMENKVTCVYGTISEHRENWENFLTNLYFGRRDQFFLVSNFRWDNSFEGECITVNGEVKLNTYKVPYIKIVDSIDSCETWMLNQ